MSNDEVLLNTFAFLNDYYAGSSSIDDQSQNLEGDLDSTSVSECSNSISSRKVSFQTQRTEENESKAEEQTRFTRNSMFRKSSFVGAAPLEQAIKKVAVNAKFHERLKSFETAQTLHDPLESSSESCDSNHTYEEVGTIRSQLTSRDNELSYQMVEFALHSPKPSLCSTSDPWEQLKKLFPKCVIKDEHVTHIKLFLYKANM